MTRYLLLFVMLVFGTTNVFPEQEAQQGSGTKWVVEASVGLDAVLLIGAASGDLLQAEVHKEDIAWLRDRFPKTGLAALESLDRLMRVEKNLLTGPVLALIFSGGPTNTLDDVIAAARAPERYLRAPLEASPYWRSGETWDMFLEAVPFVLEALEQLDDLDYPHWYSARIGTDIERSIVHHRRELEQFDVITEQERLLGWPLERRVHVLISHFSKPYGIRVLGQSFLSHHTYDADTTLRVAAHEIFHPPFDLENDSIWQRLVPLQQDPWMISLLDDSDPAYGYNSFEGLVDEGSAQALDQIVGERLGFARDPGTRWMDADGGMHMLAAALYHAMIEDRFDKSGGVYEDWLVSALDRGKLTPEEVRRHAAAVVGQEAVDAWGR